MATKRDLEAKLNEISKWCDAYPVDRHPDPDFDKAAEILRVNGHDLDAISAATMRFVLSQVKQLIEQPTEKKR